MGRLSAGDLEKAEIVPEEEEFEFPTFGGSVLLRGIMDIREHIRIETEIEKIVAAAERGIPPYQGMDSGEVALARWLQSGIADPVLSFPNCIQLLRKDGGAAGRAYRRIMDLSHRTVARFEAAEEKLRKDPFPPVDLASVPGIPASDALGSERDGAGVDGSAGLRGDQAGGRKESDGG